VTVVVPQTDELRRFVDAYRHSLGAQPFLVGLHDVLEAQCAHDTLRVWQRKDYSVPRFPHVLPSPLLPSLSPSLSPSPPILLADIACGCWYCCDWGCCVDIDVLRDTVEDEILMRDEPFMRCVCVYVWSGMLLSMCHRYVVGVSSPCCCCACLCFSHALAVLVQHLRMSAATPDLEGGGVC
jgi:hypothetical protein